MEISLLNVSRGNTQRLERQSSFHLNDGMTSVNGSASSFSDVIRRVSTTGVAGGTGAGFSSVEQFSSMLNGDYLSSFKIENPTDADRHAKPQGVARGMLSYSPLGEESINTIDKTSVLYEKALELESYFVKIMMDSMRSTLSEKSILGDESFASKMYKDMMYDQLNRTLTKHAGFGLADQIYLQLNK